MTVTMDVKVVRRDGDDHGPLEIQFEQDFEFKYQVAVLRQAFAIDSVQVTIRKGTDLFVDAQAATVGPTAGDFSFVFLKADQPDEPDENLIAEWTIKAGTDEFIFQSIFDVVRSPLTVPIKEDDLFLRFPLLRDARRLGLEEGLPESGTISTLVAAELQIYEDGYYVGGELEIIEGSNISEWREVIAFAGTTGTVTVAPDFSVPIDTTSRFRIRRSWQPVIAEAWADIRQRVKDRGNRPALIMNGQAFRRCLVYISASMCFESLMVGGEEDPMRGLAQEYEKRGWDLFDATRFLYDESDSGDPSGDIKQQVIHIPRR